MSNKRIEQLSNLAKNDVPAGLSVDEWIDCYNNNLLKLIIEDCVRIMNEQERIPAGFLYSKAATMHELAIKKHFDLTNPSDSL